MSQPSQSAGQLSGAFSAIFTPMDAEGQVNIDMLLKIADFQIASGLRGFFVCGSTGEGLLLSEQERNEVVRQLVPHVAGRATIIAHVGHPSTDVAVRLAREAAASGADWTASVAPIYHGTTFEGARRHYTKIAGATDLPFMVYSLGGEIVPERDASLFQIPNVCGLKYTGANFYSVQQLVRQLDKPVSLMSGFDEQFVAGQSFGFHGGIGSTCNFGPRFYADIFRLCHEGKIVEAASLQSQINKVTYLMAGYENWTYRKAIMRYIGLDCGAYRAPYAPISDHEFEVFAKQLDELGILQRNEAVAILNSQAT